MLCLDSRRGTGAHFETEQDKLAYLNDWFYKRVKSIAVKL